MVLDLENRHPAPAPALAATPSPTLPLCFLGAAAVGLAACGGTLVWARDAAGVDPTSDPVVAAVHLGVLATLSMAVLGALHHFIPLLTHRRLLSRRLALATFACWLLAAWLLPLGVAAGSESTVEAGGALASLTVVLAGVNLLHPLGLSGGGVTLFGLRLALIGFAATVAYGAVYVADRRAGWFDLSGRVVLAHAVVGLFAWLGLTYIAVAEKIWPMFLMARAPRGRLAPRLAVGAVPAGIGLLSPGLLVGLPPLAWSGAAVLALGLAAHLVSLVTHLRRRRGHAGVEFLFVVTSAAWLPLAASLALAAALLMGHQHRAGVALAAAAVAAVCGWLLEAVIGLAHKVSAFILWPALRTGGVVRTAAGGALQFSDLYDRRLAWISYAAVTGGLGSLCAGLAIPAPTAIATGGILITTAAMTITTNLVFTPLRRLATGHRDT